MSCRELSECGIKAVRVPRYFTFAVTLVAWIAFTVSFFLPATDAIEVSPATPLTGWQVFIGSLDVFAPSALLQIPRYPEMLLLLWLVIVNVLMFLTPALILARARVRILGGVFLFSALAPWLLPTSLVGGLYSGFYLWDLALLTMGVGCMLVCIARKKAC